MKRPRFKGRRLGRTAAGLLILFLTAPAVRSQAAAAKDRAFTLDNGLRVILLERRTLPLINIVAAVGAGTKDETDAASGVTHLLEHVILFRGTEVRSGSEVAADIRRHGAYFNAHTGPDIATFELTSPVEYADFALRNQKEILFNLKISAPELESEKEVILEEIRQIEDDPFRIASALIYQNLFPGHPYANPVYGRADVLRALTAGDVENFYRRFFVPANTALAVVGDFGLDEMEAKVREVFGSLPRSDFKPAPLAAPAPLPKTVEIHLERDVEEGYLVIGAAGPDYNNPDQFASDVLTEALGHGLSPKLVQALRGGRRDLVNSVSMNYIALKRAGAFLVYAALDPKNMDAAKKEALAYLRQVRNESFSKSEFQGEEKAYAYEHLEGARNELRISVQKAWESGLGLAQSLAMHMMLNETPSRIDYLERIAQVTPSDLRRIGARYLSRAEYVVVTVQPRVK
ncbi:MAG: pitrilysin family protein [Candidatus Aminicenantes bacterium]|nr:pitrilysin family protein [Candidatus Aminicenantes bacterium]